MDFIDHIRDLSARIQKQAEGIRLNGAMTFQPWKERPFFGLGRARKRTDFREDG